MADFDWRSFLADWSRELLAVEDVALNLPPEVRESGWLGFPGASAEQIGRAEERLGRSLPPSYRAFLKVTNGWRNTGFFIDRLWPTEDVEWFRVRHEEWITDWNRGAEYYAARNPAPAAPAAADEGPVLPFTLEISDVDDSAIYLLNPLVADADADGEWQAWFFSNWNPGAVRHRSFRKMMEAERRNFIRMRDRRR